MKPIELTTKRLILRRANEEDSKNLFHSYFSDAHRARFLTRQAHLHIDQTREVLNKWCQIYWEQVFNKFAWVVALANTNEGVGIFLVELDELHTTAQIHYGISQHFSKQGLITEAGNAVVRWLMSQDKMLKIWSVCDLSNIGSIKVLENLGFQKEKILKKHLILPAFNELPRDCYIYTFTSKRVKRISD